MDRNDVDDLPSLSCGKGDWETGKPYLLISMAAMAAVGYLLESGSFSKISEALIRFHQ